MVGVAGVVARGVTGGVARGVAGGVARGVAGGVARGVAGGVAWGVARGVARDLSRLWRGLRCASSWFCVGGTVGAGMGAFLTASFKNSESILVSGSFM